MIEARAALAALLDLTRRLGEERSLEESLQLVTDAALELLGAEHTSARLLDDTRSELVSCARSGAGAEHKPLAFRLAEGVAGWVCRQARAARIDDVREDDRFLRAPRQGWPIRSLLAVPMLAAGRVVGVMAATHEDVAAFSAEDEALCSLLANCAVPLIERARLARLTLPPRLEHALASPLRIRLVSELLQAGARGIALDDAVVRTGRYKQDVLACLKPLVEWRIVADLDDGARFRLRADLPAPMLEQLKSTVQGRSDELGRELHVRHGLLGGMIGLDPKMQLVFELVQQVARIDVPVLITGETGTGKELVARAVHDISPRRAGFFGAVNCATLTEGLFESQVFGHVRGAFTGAVADHVGLVERCHKGTLFLDEVGDLSLQNQVKLLRLLQESAFTRLGETAPRRSDFRLISATNRDLFAMVQRGTFREDLYDRLAVFPVRVPSLRERIGDVPYLVEGILRVHAQRFRTGGAPPTITPEAVDRLKQYRWPGNVRELENVMARAAIMAGDAPIGPEHLPEVELLSDRPPDDDEPDSADLAQRDSSIRTLSELERDHITAVLRSTRGNIKAAAAILEISRTTLYKKIREYGIDAPL
ncbi:MAG: sigma-54-dependent Fis family transcriptional regulator [Polyangiaceae bacterium]|nr:sigma-54-dependent Fis family transcriptional regulator [Polyangiaceae bacterium]